MLVFHPISTAFQFCVLSAWKVVRLADFAGAETALTQPNIVVVALAAGFGSFQLAVGFLCKCSMLSYGSFVSLFSEHSLLESDTGTNPILIASTQS